MKLTFISAKGGGYGASEELWCQMAIQALKKSIDVQVSVNNNFHHSHLTVIRSLGGIVNIREPFKLSTKLGKALHKIAKRIPYFNPFYKLLKFNSDVYIVNQSGSYDAVGQELLYLFLLSLSKPFYLVSHLENESGSLPSIIYSRSRILFPKAKELFFVGFRNKEMCELFTGQKFNNARVVGNPLNSSYRKEIAWPETTVPSFAVVARLDVAHKGQNLLLKVLSSDKWKKRNWLLNFYGHGEDQSYLEDLVNLFDLNERVFFKGHVKDILVVWRENHLLILPSIREGFPLSLIEAASFGRPAVVTDVGDNSRIVINNVTGFLSESCNLKSLDSALENAWQQKNQWQQIGNSAKKHLYQEVDLDIDSSLVDHIIAENSLSF